MTILPYLALLMSFKNIFFHSLLLGKVLLEGGLKVIMGLCGPSVCI